MNLNFKTEEKLNKLKRLYCNYKCPNKDKDYITIEENINICTVCGYEGYLSDVNVVYDLCEDCQVEEFIRFIRDDLDD